jgi:uncharacterized Fe-S radical SAM superfamily protein PflX
MALINQVRKFETLLPPLSESEMKDRVKALREKLEDCDICPLECGVDRLSGVARKGLLVRHLVLPEELAGSEEVLRFVAEEISRNTYVNIMDQYRPCWKASEYPELKRNVSMDEYEEVMERARELSLRGLWSSINPIELGFSPNKAHMYRKGTG